MAAEIHRDVSDTTVALGEVPSIRSGHGRISPPNCLAHCLTLGRGGSRTRRMCPDPAGTAELSGPTANHLAGSGLDARPAGPLSSRRSRHPDVRDSVRMVRRAGTTNLGPWRSTAARRQSVSGSVWLHSG